MPRPRAAGTFPSLGRRAGKRRASAAYANAGYSVRHHLHSRRVLRYRLLEQPLSAFGDGRRTLYRERARIPRIVPRRIFSNALHLVRRTYRPVVSE